MGEKRIKRAGPVGTTHRHAVSETPPRATPHARHQTRSRPSPAKHTHTLTMYVSREKEERGKFFRGLCGGRLTCKSEVCEG